MYDIKALEEQWKQYNRNKRKPYVIAALSVVLVGGSLALYSFKNNMFTASPTTKSGLITKSSDDGTTFVLIDSSIRAIQEQDKVEMVKPDVKVVSEDRTVEEMPTLPMIDDIPVLDEKPKAKMIKKQPKITVASKEKVIKKPKQKMHLNIVESSSVSAYKDVEKRFYQSHDTDDSLFLAKSYYRKGNYKKSEYWALQTNKVNSNIEESWIVFAKSKVKLGRTNEAIRILTNYVKRSNSKAANTLLNELKKD